MSNKLEGIPGLVEEKNHPNVVSSFVHFLYIIRCSDFADISKSGNHWLCPHFGDSSVSIFPDEILVIIVPVVEVIFVFDSLGLPFKFTDAFLFLFGLWFGLIFDDSLLLKDVRPLSVFLAMDKSEW